MIPAKYSAAFLNVVVIIAGALTAALTGPITLSTLDQLGLLVAGATAVFLVPLAAKKWQGLFKTGIALVVAILTALAPLVVSGHITLHDWLLVGLAALQALATELGVQIRTDTASLVGAGAATFGGALSALPAQIGSAVAGAVAAVPVPVVSAPVAYSADSVPNPASAVPPAADPVASSPDPVQSAAAPVVAGPVAGVADPTAPPAA